MSLELHPVEWLHAPINPSKGALQDFANWDEPGILRILTNAVQRLEEEERVQRQKSFNIKIFKTPPACITPVRDHSITPQ